MSTVAEKLHKWSVNELSLVSESGLSTIPDIESFRSITKGKNKRLWTYVINHVRSQPTVDKIKRALYIKKLLDEKKENCASLNDNSLKIARLQTAISKATEKRAYLMRSSSAIKERIVHLEHDIHKTKDETLQMNEKTALLIRLKQMYDEKNLYLKDVFSQILLHKNALSAYQSAKLCNTAVMALPYDFLYGNKAIYDQNNSRVKDLISMFSSILKNNFHQESKDSDILIKNFKSYFYKLKDNDILLTDFVILLKEISGSDLQNFASANLLSLSVEDSVLGETQKRPSDILLTQLKCDNVYNSLSSKKNRENIKNFLVIKEKTIESKIKNIETESNDLNFEVKCTLFETLAENDALVISNDYLENFLKDMSDETQLVLKKIRQHQLCIEEHNSFLETFYKNADFTFYLLYTFPDAIKKTLDSLDGLQSFAHNELFELPFPRKKIIKELLGNLVCDRKLTWEFFDRTNVFQPLFSEPHLKSHLSSEISKSLNIKPFQNISTLCENWTYFKQKLRAEVIAEAKVRGKHNDISVPELNAKFLTMLEKMKFSVKKGMLFINDGMTCCLKTKSLIQEWWEQNAQYLPPIEYEGKTLKMWIDILSVLSDFEPENCI